MRSFWFIVGFLLLALTALRAWFLRCRQNRRLRELAHCRRLNFTPDDLIGVHERFQNLRLIRQGHRRCAWNLIYGTTDIGFIALFCYRYDLGFGTRQTLHQRWIAVVETPFDHPCWQAQSVANKPRIDSQPSTEMAGFIIHTDYESTIDMLRLNSLDSILQNAASADRLESHHRFVAATAPYSRDIETPTCLLDTALQLARLMQPNEKG